MQHFLRLVAAALFCIVHSNGANAQQLDLIAGGLQNWVKADGQPVASHKWELTDGTLHLTGGGGGDIYWREPVENFVLSFDWRISEKGNSGIKYRVQKYGNSWLGCEYQLQDDGSNPVGKHSTGSLYDVIEPSSARLPNPAGQWNSSKIVVYGNHIEHWLNGTLVVSTTAGSADWMTRVANSKFKPQTGWGQNPTGRLLLQDHGNEVWFRNLNLTRINNQIAGSSSRTTLPQGLYPHRCGSPVGAASGCVPARSSVLRNIFRGRIFCR